MMRLRQIRGFFRREVVDLVRQPQLILLMVLGPFSVLLLFGAGYRNEPISLRTIFIGPDAEQLEALIAPNQGEIEEYVVPVGYGSDLIEATATLERGDVDLVVVFPDDPMTEVSAGRRAEVAVLHREIDPIRQVAVEIASEVATAKVNAAVLTEIVAAVQDDLRATRPAAENVSPVGMASVVENGNDRQTRAGLDRIDQTLAWMEAGSRLRPGLGADAADRADRIAEARSTAAELRSDPSGPGAPAKAAELDGMLIELSGPVDEALLLDPDIVTQPFSSDAESLLIEPVDEVDFFVPSALGLLLQHATVSLAALSLMRDRRLGLLDVFQAGPSGSGVILLGKYLAYLAAGLVVGALLLAATTIGLGVNIVGSLGWAGAGMSLSLLASLSLGLVVALIARSDVQAVQVSMLVLLLGLFLGGFFLDLDTLRHPIRDIAWLMPVTFTIRILQDVMLRGNPPATIDLVGLTVQCLGYAALAWWLLSRQLRVD